MAFAACSSGGGGSAKPDIRIGSDGFYESKLVAEMYAQVLEADGYKVTRNLGIGAREVRQPALESGQIDLSPEYVGSGLGYYDPAQPTGDGPTNREALAKVLKEKAASACSAITPGEDTNAAVVRQDTADQYSLTKMSDLAAVQDDLKWGLPPDCDANPLCKGALEAVRHHLPARPARGARRVRRADRRGARRQGRSTSPGCAPRSRRSRSSGSSPSRTTRTPSPPRT